MNTNLQIVKASFQVIMLKKQQSSCFNNLKGLHPVKKMKESGWGRIINIASLQSLRAFDNSIPYGASKGGVMQLTRALAQAYSKDGVLVNAIAPGFFRTNLTESLYQDSKKIKDLAGKTMMNRNGEEKDIFGISVFLCSDANSYITGQTIFLDGGFSAA